MKLYEKVKYYADIYYGVNIVTISLAFVSFIMAILFCTTTHKLSEKKTERKPMIWSLLNANYFPDHNFSSYPNAKHLHTQIHRQAHIYSTRCMSNSSLHSDRNSIHARHSPTMRQRMIRSRQTLRQ